MVLIGWNSCFVVIVYALIRTSTAMADTSAVPHAVPATTPTTFGQTSMPLGLGYCRNANGTNEWDASVQKCGLSLEGCFALCEAQNACRCYAFSASSSDYCSSNSRCVVYQGTEKATQGSGFADYNAYAYVAPTPRPTFDGETWSPTKAPTTSPTSSPTICEVINIEIVAPRYFADHMGWKLEGVEGCGEIQGTITGPSTRTTTCCIGAGTYEFVALAKYSWQGWYYGASYRIWGDESLKSSIGPSTIPYGSTSQRETVVVFDRLCSDCACPRGSYCPASGLIYPCPVGTFNPSEGGVSIEACVACTAGNFCSEEGSPTNGTACVVGSYCPAGSAVEPPCPAGSYCETPDTIAACSVAGTFCPKGSTSSDGTACGIGSYCPAGSAVESPCPAGSYCATPGTIAHCSNNGSYCPKGSTSDGTACRVGSYCPAGSAVESPCPAGSYCATPGTIAHCSNNGSYCPEGSTAPDNLCPSGSFCINSGSIVACPVGTYNPNKGRTNLQSCVACSATSVCYMEGNSADGDQCNSDLQLVYVEITVVKDAHELSWSLEGAEGCGESKGSITVTHTQACCVAVGTYVFAGMAGWQGKGTYRVFGDTLKSTIGPSQVPRRDEKVSIEILCDGCTCPRGSFCPESVSGFILSCPAGTFNPSVNGKTIEACQACSAGVFCPSEGSSDGNGTACGVGSYCPAGSAIESPCPGGSYCESPDMIVHCAVGTGSLPGSTRPTDCVLCAVATTTGIFCAHANSFGELRAAVAVAPKDHSESVVLINSTLINFAGVDGMDDTSAIVVVRGGQNVRIQSSSEVQPLLDASGDVWIGRTRSKNRRHFEVNKFATLKVVNLHLSKGSTPTLGHGAAVWNRGTLTATNCTFSANVAQGSGGAVYNDAGGIFKSFDSIFVGNSAGVSRWGRQAHAGGGVHNNVGSTNSGVKSGIVEFYGATRFVGNIPASDNKCDARDEYVISVGGGKFSCSSCSGLPGAYNGYSMTSDGYVTCAMCPLGSYILTQDRLVSKGGAAAGAEILAESPSGIINRSSISEKSITYTRRNYGERENAVIELSGPGTVHFIGAFDVGGGGGKDGLTVGTVQITGQPNDIVVAKGEVLRILWSTDGVQTYDQAGFSFSYTFPLFADWTVDICTPCGAGRHSAVIGASSEAACQLCPTGRFEMSTGASECSACPRGRFLGKTGALTIDECTTCSNGFVAAFEGSQFCEICASGEYEVNHQTCKSCEEGFSCSSGKRVACSSGTTYQDKTGQISCLACKICPPGTRQEAPCTVASDTSCIDCPPGTFSDDGKACFPCYGDGKYSSESKSTFCSTAKAGNIPTLDRTGTTPCQEQTFSAGGTDVCTHCEKGAVSKAGATFCKFCGAGAFTNGTVCTLCPRGYYKQPGSALYNACQLCPVNTFQDEPGQAICKECAGLPNKRDSKTFGIVAAYDSNACVLCPTGAECTADTVRQALAKHTSAGDITGRTVPTVFTQAEIDMGEVAIRSAFSVQVEELGLCPSDCPTCHWPRDGYYRFPPNTCVDYGDGCPDCPVASETCIKCPASANINTRYVCASNHGCANRNASGSTNSVSSLLTGCAEGYVGVLCATCAPNFTPSGEFDCVPCRDRGTIRLLSALIAMMMILLVAYLIRSTLASEGKIKDLKVMILKLLISHLQVVSLMRDFPLEWPKSIRKFLEVTGVASPTFSTYCELAHWSSFPSPFFAEAAITAILPVGLSAITTYFWIARSVYLRRKDNNDTDARHSQRETKNRIIVSIVVVLFFQHISLTTTALGFFSCIGASATDPASPTTNVTLALDGGELAAGDGSGIFAFGEHSFLAADMRIECTAAGGPYLAWAVGLGGSMLVFYALGIPFLALLILYSIKDDLETWRGIFGFLFSSYRPECWYASVHPALLQTCAPLVCLLVLVCIRLTLVGPRSLD